MGKGEKRDRNQQSFSWSPKKLQKSQQQKFVKQIKGMRSSGKGGVGENALKIYALFPGGERQEQEQIPAGAACHRRLGGRGSHCLQAPTFLCFFSLFLYLYFFTIFFALFVNMHGHVGKRLKDIGPTD